MNARLKNTVRQFLPRTIKPHRIRGGPLQNYRIVTSWYDYPAAIFGYTERPLLDWFAENVRPGETWLDIGAHYGYTALALAQYVGVKGRVLAFEPMLTSAGCIAQTRQLNHLTQLTVLPLALGDAGNLLIQELPTVRGMLDSTRAQGSHSNGNEPMWSETLLVVALDQVWQAIAGNDAAINGIKIDVQGMELVVLRGMMNLLQMQHPKLVIEVHEGVARADLLALVEQAGYTSNAIPIEPIEGETSPQWVNDKSYAFLARNGTV